MKKIKHKKKILSGAIIGLILMITIFSLTSSKNTESDEKGYKITKVTKISPLIVTGKIKATRTQVVTLPQGKVQQILVDNGAHVDAGQALATTYSQVSQNSMDDLNQEIAQQQRKATELKRQLDLVKGQDDQARLSEIQDSYNDANDELTNLQTKLKRGQSKVNGTAIAPFGGTVAIDYTKMGTPSITIYGDDLIFKANVSEYDYDKLQLNTNLKVTALASKEKSIDTKINFISNEPAATSKANDAKYEFTAPINNHFMNGQTVRASVEQAGLSIPTTCVKKQGVYVVNKKHVVSFKAITGKTESGHFKVEKGLRAGQLVIVNPDKSLRDGSKVSVDD